MANIVKWSPLGTLTTYLATALDGLGIGANKLGAAISNDGSTERNRFISFELTVNTQGSARNATARVEIYFLASLDGTAFSFGDDSTDPAPGTPMEQLGLDAATTARIVTAYNIPIPPLDFKLLLMNETGVAFAATGNVLKYLTHNEEMVVS